MIVDKMVSKYEQGAYIGAACRKTGKIEGSLKYKGQILRTQMKNKNIQRLWSWVDCRQNGGLRYECELQGTYKRDTACRINSDSRDYAN